MVLEWVIVGVVIVIVLAFVLIYNGLVRLKLQVDNAWSQIDVQLKKRHDLIPNLVETVKGYASHEKSIFIEVTKARAAVMSAKNPREQAKASNMLTDALKSLFAVAENYPQLKANENFKLLQEQLEGIESKIAYARQFYNDSVMEFNQSIHTIPNNFFAGMLGYTDREFFKVDDEERENVKVKF